MAGLRTTDWVVGELTTTDATATTALSYTIPQNGVAFHVEATVVGKDTATNDAIISRKVAAGKRQTGTTAIIGAVVNVWGNITEDPLSTTSVTLTTTTTDVLVVVTGKLATTIDWHVELKIIMN